MGQLDVLIDTLMNKVSSPDGSDWLLSNSLYLIYLVKLCQCYIDIVSESGVPLLVTIQRQLFG